MSSSALASRRLTTPFSVNWPISPVTCGGSPTSTVSSGLPARMHSRCAVCAATAWTSQPGRSVGVVHSSSGTFSSRSRKSLTASPPDVDVTGELSASSGAVATLMRAQPSAPMSGAARETGRVTTRVRAPELTRPRLAQHRRAAESLRDLRGRFVLLDFWTLLLHQLPARPRRAAPGRGGVRRRAGRRRRALAEVRARGRPGRAGRGGRALRRPPPGAGRPRPDRPGRPTRRGPGRRSSGRPGGLRRRALRRRGARARDRPRCWRARRRAPRDGDAAAGRLALRPAGRGTDRPALPGRRRSPLPDGHVLVADAGHDAVVLLDADGRGRAAVRRLPASPTASACPGSLGLDYDVVVADTVAPPAGRASTSRPAR